MTVTLLQDLQDWLHWDQPRHAAPRARLLVESEVAAMVALVEAAQRTLDNADNPSFKWPETVKNLRSALAAFTEDKP